MCAALDRNSSSSGLPPSSALFFVRPSPSVTSGWARTEVPYPLPPGSARRRVRWRALWQHDRDTEEVADPQVVAFPAQRAAAWAARTLIIPPTVEVDDRAGRLLVEDLVEQARTRDADAWEALYRL